MSAAFPLLRTLGHAPRMTKVRADAAWKARCLLFGGMSRAQSSQGCENSMESFHCNYHIGEGFTIPMTFIGSCEEYGEEMVLVHVPGLPGAFPVAVEKLRRHKYFFHLKEEDVEVVSEEVAQLGLLSVMEAVKKRIGDPEVLDHLLSVARRRQASLRGAELLISIGNRINEEALQLSFPYHYGNHHASKRYFDITPEACTLFGNHMKHGAKMLCRYGVAVMVGIAADESLGCPVPFWNPSGAPAACLAPMFNSCHSILVGEVKLDYNGPIANSDLATPEDPARYLNPTLDGVYDVSSWLNEGLFGVKVGQLVENGCVVHGVCYNEGRQEFELHVRELSTGEIRPSVSSLLRSQ